MNSAFHSKKGNKTFKRQTKTSLQKETERIFSRLCIKKYLLVCFSSFSTVLGTLTENANDSLMKNRLNIVIIHSPIIVLQNLKFRSIFDVEDTLGRKNPL